MTEGVQLALIGGVIGFASSLLVMIASKLTQYLFDNFGRISVSAKLISDLKSSEVEMFISIVNGKKSPLFITDLSVYELEKGKYRKFINLQKEKTSDSKETVFLFNSYNSGMISPLCQMNLKAGFVKTFLSTKQPITCNLFLGFYDNHQRLRLYKLPEESIHNMVCLDKLLVSKNYKGEILPPLFGKEMSSN